MTNNKKSLPHGCGVYKITNTVTGDFYIGSSKNIARRWAEHRQPSQWFKGKHMCPLYKAMEEYGSDMFTCINIAFVEEQYLLQAEQEFIDLLKPTYNVSAAYVVPKEPKAKLSATEREQRKKEYHKKYNKSDKFRSYQKSRNDRLCNYNGETIKFNALVTRFRNHGHSEPTKEAKKYLISEQYKTKSE